jgi:hypothetical protein
LIDASPATARSKSFIREQVRDHRFVVPCFLTLSQDSRNLADQYVMDDPASYCLVITRTSISIVKLPGKEALSSLAIAFLNKLKAKERARDEARRLYDVLLGGLLRLHGVKQLIIVRDGQLHLVPFDALGLTQQQLLT